MSENKPLKRSDDIVALSREHHHGLLFCWKIKQGLAKKVNLGRLQKYVNYFWQEHLEQHFKDEEVLLFSEVSDKLCDDAVQQHVEIAQLVKDINTEGRYDESTFRSLASALDQHIRYEERLLFPFLEVAIAPEKMAEIGKIIRQTHETAPADDYPDKFW